MGKKTKTEKETYIALVIDKSTSMHSSYSAALNAINEQIDTIKDQAKKGGKTYVTIIAFSHVIDVLAENVPAEQLEHLTEEDYVLGGTTALRDAMLTAVEMMQDNESRHKNQGFLTILISDGQENASGTTREKLQSVISEKEGSDRWTFTYMLDGHGWEEISDMFSFAGSHGGNYSTYTSDLIGTAKAGEQIRSATVNYMAAREQGVQCSTSFYDDTKKTT